MDSLKIEFRPSFHPAVQISVDVDPSGGMVGLEAEHWNMVGELPAVAAQVFRALLAATQPERLESVESFGLDGVMIRCTFVHDGKSHEFSVWSPDKRRCEPHERLIVGTYQLAIDVLRDAESMRLLENLHGYLCLGLPIRDMGGSPRVVRVFGSCAVGKDTAHEMQKFFQMFNAADRIVIDMTHFDSMAGLLKPVFCKIMSQFTDVRWVTNENARVLLFELGVDEQRIFPG